MYSPGRVVLLYQPAQQGHYFHRRGHPDEEGAFTEATYQSLLKLVHWLQEEFHLSTDQVIRHYDVTGKECPRYYVEHPEQWEQFKADLEQMPD